MPAEFWLSQLGSMRHICFFISETYVFESVSEIIGFYSLYENTLAGIFVKPNFQGKGTGKQLMAHAKEQRTQLVMSVYKENKASYKFYQSQGFIVVSKQADEHTGHQEYSMSYAG